MKIICPAGIGGEELMRRVDAKTRKYPHGCWVWTGWTANRYPMIELFHKPIRVNRLIAWLHLGYNGERDLEVCHRCNIKECIKPDHLYLASHRQNIRDAERDGLVRHLYGENHPRAKLNQNDVMDILWLLDHGKRAADLARTYGVDKSAISLIKRGINWKYLRDGSPTPAEEGGERCV